MDFLILVSRIAIGGAYPGSALVRAATVANVGINHNMWFYFSMALVPVAYQAQAFG
jgi:hypothetical protein